MEVHVFFRGKVPSVAALARAMKELGFPFTIPNAKGSLTDHGGYRPMKLRREETGVEINIFENPAAIAEFAHYGVDQSYERLASFRWGGDLQEGGAALCAAAALAKLTDGAVFDEGAAKLLSLPEAIAAARQFLDALPKPNPRYGTHPADIKRYLKPLLELRSDLALIDRMLVIRPVRHLLRGALLDRTSDRHVLHLHWLIKPLCHGTEPIHTAAIGIQHGSVSRLDVRTPDFESILFDCLAGDIFELVAKVDSLAAYEAFIAPKSHWPETLFAPILLTDGIERASDYLEKLGHGKTVPEWVTKGRTFLHRGPEDVFGHFHGIESATAKVLKIDHVWERSPFPAETSEPDSTTTTEPKFDTTPWVNLPGTWRQDVPNAPGEFRFGLSWWRRAGHVFLSTPLTEEEAALRHAEYKTYLLATALTSGALLLMQYGPSMGATAQRRQDGSLSPPSSFEIGLIVYGRSGLRLRADFRNWFRDPGELALSQIDIVVADTWQHHWYSFVDLREGVKRMHDFRTGQTIYTPSIITDDEQSRFILPIPSFCDFMALWDCVRTFLNNEGYGPFV